MNTQGSSLAYSQIDAIRTNLKSYSSDMDAVLNEVKGLLSKVGTDAVWSGTAAQSAKEEFDRLSAKFQEFGASVNRCSEYLGTVVSNYQAVDQQLMGEEHVTN